MKKKFTLLYVEDDPIVQENLTAIFKEYFETVLTTDNGNKALEIYNNNKIDIAILDISIKGISGIDVATKIREKDSRTHILMISAYSDKEKLLKVVNLKLIGYLVKPITFGELDQSLQKIFSKLENKDLLPLKYNFFWDEEESNILYKNEKMKLTKNEKMIVKLLLKNRNNYMSAQNIYEELYIVKDIESKQNNIVQLLSRFKKKTLNKYKVKDYFIENCYGLGYRIVIS